MISIRELIRNNKDKVYHFCVSAALVCVLAWVSIPFAVIATLLIGVSKEFHDQLQENNHFDMMDLIADILGVIAGFVYILLMKIL